MSPDDNDPLVDALAETRAAMDAQTIPDFASRVRARLEGEASRPRGRARLGHSANALRGVFVAVLLVIVVVTVAVGAGLGLPSLPFRFVEGLASPAPGPDLSADARRLELGVETSPDEAQRRARFGIQVPAGLDPPDYVLVADLGGEVMVSLLFNPRPNLPSYDAARFGALLTEVSGTVQGVLMEKLIDAGATVVPAEVNGDRGFWITGGAQELFFHDPENPGVAFRQRLAGDALIWESDKVIYRMESGLDLPANLALAEDLVALVP